MDSMHYLALRLAAAVAAVAVAVGLTSQFHILRLDFP
jgi:hypothetical protein